MVYTISDNHEINSNLKIASIIYSIYINNDINIKKAHNIFKGSKVYDNNKLNFQMTNPKSTICMIRSGYIRSMGTKSIKQSQKTINITLNNLVKNKIINENYKIIKRKIENIVASGIITEEVDLEELSLYLDNVIYEPEQFPAIIYRPKSTIVILIFSSKKIVIVGAKKIEDINDSYYNLIKKLNKKLS